MPWHSKEKLSIFHQWKCIKVECKRHTRTYEIACHFSGIRALYGEQQFLRFYCILHFEKVIFISYRIFLTNVYDWASFLLLFVYTYAPHRQSIFLRKCHPFFKWAKKMPHFFFSSSPLSSVSMCFGSSLFGKTNNQTNKKKINFPFQLDGNGQFFGIICKHATLFSYFLSIAALIVTLAK